MSIGVYLRLTAVLVILRQVLLVSCSRLRGRCDDLDEIVCAVKLLQLIHQLDHAIDAARREPLERDTASERVERSPATFEIQV